MKRSKYLALLLFLIATPVAAQNTGTPSQLRVLTDANGYLVVASVAQTNPTTTSTFINTRLKTDSNGYLQIVNTGGPFTGQLLGPVGCTTIPYSFTGRTTTGLCSSAADTWDLYGGNTLGLQGNTTDIIAPLPISLVSTGVKLSAADGILTLLGLGNGNDENLTFDFDNGDANTVLFGTGTGVTTIRYSEIISEVLRAGIATTSTDAFVALNNTAATALATVQMPPRFRQRGSAWDTAASQTIDWTQDFLPVSAATPTSTYNWKTSLNGAAYTTPMSLTSVGNLTLLGPNLVYGANCLNSVGGVVQVLASNCSGNNAILQSNRVTAAGAGAAYTLGSGAEFAYNVSITIASGFNDGGATAPSIVSGNTLGFRITVGDGAADTVGVITLQGIDTFWNCFITDQTTPLDITRQTASTTTSVTFTTTIAWTAGDVLVGFCVGQ